MLGTLKASHKLNNVADFLANCLAGFFKATDIWLSFLQDSVQ